MILVTGAAGKTGRAVITALAAKGASVRALVRSAAHAAALKTLGAAEIAVGGFDDAAALESAAAGVTAIYHICPNVSRDEVPYARNVHRRGEGAAASPASSFIPCCIRRSRRCRTTGRRCGSRKCCSHPASHSRSCSRRPTCRTFSGYGARSHEQGVLRVPYPVETRLSLVDLDDVAAAAALVLTDESHAGATYELVGTPPLSQIEVAAAIGTALGRAVRAEAETVEAWETRARAGGMADYERTTLTAMFRYYADYGLVGNPNTLRWLLGRAPNDLPTVIARHSASQ